MTNDEPAPPAFVIRHLSFTGGANLPNTSIVRTDIKHAHGEQEARRLVAEGMAIAGLSDEDLEKLPGSDSRKVAVGRVVWERTTVGMPWLAEHLHLRSAVNASQQIRRYPRQTPALARKLQKWVVQSRNAA